jgi:hypothetical protein
MKAQALILIMLAAVLSGRAGLAEDVRRTHMFLRPLAMGGAFTAVADSGETVAYNPAGLRSEGPWTLSFPLVWLVYNDMVRAAMNRSLDFDLKDGSSIESLKGRRAFLEWQVGLPFWYMPDPGFFVGFSQDLWFDFRFPTQTIIPLVHLEVVSQTVGELAMSFDLFETGLCWGFNLKTIKRIGFAGVVSPIRVANLIDQLDPIDIPDRLIEAYNRDPPQTKLVLDIGFLYRFDHPWHPRVGISVLDMASWDLDGGGAFQSGGVDYGSAGRNQQLNSVGAAVTRYRQNVALTASADLHDVSFSYFPDNSLRRRVSVGFEVAFLGGRDQSRPLAIQLGAAALRYPSIGIQTRVGFLEASAAQWQVNLGTEANERVDRNYMFVIAFVF